MFGKMLLIYRFEVTRQMTNPNSARFPTLHGKVMAGVVDGVLAGSRALQNNQFRQMVISRVLEPSINVINEISIGRFTCMRPHCTSLLSDCFWVGQ